MSHDEQMCFTYCTLLNAMMYTHWQVGTISHDQVSKSIKLETFKGKEISGGVTMMQQYKGGVVFSIMALLLYADFEVVNT